MWLPEINKSCSYFLIKMFPCSLNSSGRETLFKIVNFFLRSWSAGHHRRTYFTIDLLDLLILLILIVFTVSTAFVIGGYLKSTRLCGR